MLALKLKSGESVLLTDRTDEPVLVTMTKHHMSEPQGTRLLVRFLPTCSQRDAAYWLEPGRPVQIKMPDGASVRIEIQDPTYPPRLRFQAHRSVTIFRGELVAARVAAFLAA